MLMRLMLATGMINQRMAIMVNPEYDIELDEINYPTDEIERSNMETVVKSLVKIQEILRNIESRLGALE